MACWRLIVMTAASALLLGCSSSSTTGSPAPTPVTPVVNMVGAWTGTLEIPAVSSRQVTLNVVQGGSCVDGSWSSVPAGWSGAISGFASTDSFSGQVSFERAADQGGHCLVSGNVVGAVTGDSIHWTVSDLAPLAVCAGVVPKSLVLTLQRG